MTRVEDGLTIEVAFLDRLSRNFDDVVRIQAELTRRNISIVAIRENIDTRGGECRGEVLPAVYAGPESLPGEFSQRADSAGVGPGPRQ